MKKHVAAPVQQVHDRQLTILRLPQVKARTGRSRSSIYADIKAGRFVAPISIGRRSVGWLAHEVDDWISARMVESRGESR